MIFPLTGKIKRPNSLEGGTVQIKRSLPSRILALASKPTAGHVLKVTRSESAYPAPPTDRNRPPGGAIRGVKFRQTERYSFAEFSAAMALSSWARDGEDF